MLKNIKPFFTFKEGEMLRKHKYSIEDNSFSSKYLYPMWQSLQKHVPKNIAPNVISFFGFLCTFLALVLSYQGHILLDLLSTIFVFIYINLDCIDGIHARINNNSSPIGEFIDHACDSVSAIFLSLTACNIFGITNKFLVIIIAQIVLFNFILCHVKAYVENIVKFDRYTGPTELLLYYCVLASIKIVAANSFKLDWLDSYFGYVVILYIFMLCKLLLYSYKNIKDNDTILCIFATIFSTILANNIDHPVLSCLSLSVLASDVIVCKMSKKTSSIMVLLVGLFSIFNLYLSSIMALLYFIFILREMGNILKLKIFFVN
jgi:phosphatidylglycerophosphate synthase